MKLVTVFYAGQLHEEADKWIPVHTIPDGAYVLNQNKAGATWYVIRYGGATPINLSDVPKELRLLLLIIN